MLLFIDRNNTEAGAVEPARHPDIASYHGVKPSSASAGYLGHSLCQSAADRSILLLKNAGRKVLNRNKQLRVRILVAAQHESLKIPDGCPHIRDIPRAHFILSPVKLQRVLQ